MGGDEDLYPLPLQFKQDFDHRSEQPGIQVRLGLIPEQDRTLEQGAILNQQPQQTEFAETLGKQRKFQAPLSAPEKKLFVSNSDLAIQSPSQFFEKLSTGLIRGT